MVDEQPIRRRRTSILIAQKDMAKVTYPGDDDDLSEIHEDDDNDDDGDNKYEKYRMQRQDSVHSTSSLTKRAFASFKHTAELSLTSNRVDAFLAAFGCAGSLALLQFLTINFPHYEVSGSFLVSSAIKFFFNENPPSLDAFVRSSIFAILVGFSLHFVPSFSETYSRSILLFFTLFYWKLQGGLWGAANSLAVIVAVQSGGWATVMPKKMMRDLNRWANNNDTDTDPHFPWHFLLFPYISGHMLLYVLACLFSVIRRNARVYLIRREFIKKEVAGRIRHLRRHSIVSGAERRKRLLHLFRRIDTSGDGQLDAIELQVALRAATGNDISLADTSAMIRSVDSDGNGTVDFDEFCASIDKLWIE